MAKTVSFKPGSTVYCGTVKYEVAGPAGLTAVKVRDTITGEIRILPQLDLSASSSEAKKVASTPLDCLPPEKQVVALKRFAIIEPAVREKLSRKQIEELAAKNGCHFTTLYKMIRLYEETKSPASLVPKTGNRGGKGKHRITQAVEDLIRLHFNDIVKAKAVDITKVTVKSLHIDIKMKCKSEQM